MNQRQIAAILGILVGVGTGSSILNRYCTGGYKIVVEGQTIGYVDDDSNFENALSSVNNALASEFGDEYTINPDVEITGTIINKSMLTTTDELHNNIATLSDYMTDGYILVANGREICNLKTKKEALDIIDDIIDKFRIDGGVSTIREKVEIKEKKVSASTIMDFDEAFSYIIDNSLLNVKSTIATVYYSTKDFEVIEQTDDTLIKGAKKVMNEGEVGEYRVSATIEYNNGVLAGKSILSQEVISQPVAQIVRVGTKEVPNSGTGSFIMPTSGRLSSGYGSRWGRTHKGIDLAAPIGTPIVASDTGVVIHSQSSGSYGKVVKIDHNNGFVTVYAHCDELLVSEGEIVSKGQLIARVGNTGNSTGPHCHFEIQLNGTAQNPFDHI